MSGGYGGYGGYEEIADGRRSIRLSGLPDFNATDANFRITGFDGWFAAPTPDAQFAANGGYAGAVASGSWLAKEQPMELRGFIEAPQVELPGFARSLAAALPATSEAAIQVLANGRDTVDLQAFVRRYDRAEMPISSRLDFTIPIIALDPYKYGVTPLVGGMSVYAGSVWYEPYAKPGADWVETYEKQGGVWVETYTLQQPTGPYPPALTLTPPAGGIASRRLTFTVVGPLTAGDWQLSQDGTGKVMWVSAAVAAGQTLTIDCYAERATMGGEDLTRWLYGDMLTLEPGGSTYRLTSSTQNLTAYALASALPAYEI